MAKNVVVIGGGAAGMMAAGRAAAAGASVTLLEKNSRLGEKVLITGKGRCNLTNATDITGLIENIPGNGRFLHSALNTFSNRDLIRFMEKQGVPTKVERGNRVFPVSDRAEDVVRALEKYVRESGVRVVYDAAAVQLDYSDSGMKGVRVQSGGHYPAEAVILCAGGASYPGTGSNGDGYRMAAAAGHTIVPLRPSLVPLLTAEAWVKDTQGLTLKNVLVTLWTEEGRKLADEFGEILFTHFGVSGPTILTLSRTAVEYTAITGKKPGLKINLKPALTEEQLDDRLKRDFSAYQRKQFKNALGDLFPRTLIPVIISLSGIEERRYVHQITKEERSRLRDLISGMELTVKGPRPLAEAVVTAGGVSTKEINPKTLESKLIRGLYFAGEVIDVDGLTGGFNLQAAFSTGYTAGQAAAGDI